MSIIYNRFIPFKRNKVINIFGFLFARTDSRVNESDVRHQQIHTLQMKEMLYVGFYIWYAIEWLLRFFFNPRTAGRKVSLEREARTYQYSPYYSPSRVSYSWLTYCLKWKN
jgi:hypothetical protein